MDYGEPMPPERGQHCTNNKNLKEDILLGLVKVYETANGFHYERDCIASLRHPKYKSRRNFKVTTEAEKALVIWRKFIKDHNPYDHLDFELMSVSETIIAALQAQQKPKQTLKDLTDKITDENRHDPVPENRHEAVEVTQEEFNDEIKKYSHINYPARTVMILWPHGLKIVGG